MIADRCRPLPLPTNPEGVQEACQAAASERARRDAEAREAEVRRQLAAERDEELAAVVGHLEEDFLGREAQLQVGGLLGGVGGVSS